MVGRPTPVFLPPYESYDLRIVASSDHITAYDTKPRRVTLFPGTTSVVAWDIDRIFILVTAVVFSDGSPVADARVEGALGTAVTDENGMLQTEVRGRSRLTLRNRKTGLACEVAVPEPAPGEEIIVVHELVCQ